ncbi:MAG TPA: ABC transporter ATP-binding protein [Gammaproteobacteria bacterium]|nr:ABC transporter ATP-binding protein [Gammaproteobacteria bacterium]
MAPPAGAPDPAFASEAVPALELELVRVGKTFESRQGPIRALTGIDLSVRRSEFVAIVGRSGCGKTTLLRILAGLVPPSDGDVRAGGRPLWVGSTRDREAVSKLGLVFQEPNLFPWYSIEDNVALPLKLRGVAKAERRARARELCATVGLGGFERSYPRELSGGMRQRAAIARALSYRPEILLMDEPFGALDALTRDKMNLDLQSIALATRATVVLVTHSITEAVFLADRVVLLTPRPGRIRSITPVPFERPRTLDLQAEPGFQDIARELRHQLDEDGPFDGSR